MVDNYIILPLVNLTEQNVHEPKHPEDIGKEYEISPLCLGITT